jgi:flagellar basal body rod protein FlgG
MYYGMYLSAAGAYAQSQRMEVISNNIANVGTAGFKRELGVLQSRAAEGIEQGFVSPGMGRVEDVGGGVHLSQTSTDFAVGPVRETGELTDFALPQPEAFFAVQKDGQEYLTRAGNFQFRADGTLITSQGYPVLGADGSPIQVDRELPFTVSPKGEIVQAGDTKALAVRRPQSLGDLVREGENLFRPIGTAPQSVPDAQRQVYWKHLEQSAVQPHREMIEMITTSRAYEANVRMMQNHDSMLGGLVGRMLKA